MLKVLIWLIFFIYQLQILQQWTKERNINKRQLLTHWEWKFSEGPSITFLRTQWRIPHVVCCTQDQLRPQTPSRLSGKPQVPQKIHSEGCQKRKIDYLWLISVKRGAPTAEFQPYSTHAAQKRMNWCLNAVSLIQVHVSSFILSTIS